MRVLLPASLVSLARAVSSGSFLPLAGTGYLAARPDPDEPEDGDELDLLAAEAAAAASLRQLGDAGPQVPARRVVLAADVPEPMSARQPGDPDVGLAELVLIETPVPMSAVASVLIDGESLTATVRAALPVAAEPTRSRDDQVGDPGRRAAWAARDRVEASPLLWFDRSEIGALVDGVEEQ